VHGSRQLSEGFTYEKTNTTTNDCSRIALRRDTRARGAQKSVVRWSAVSSVQVVEFLTQVSVRQNRSG